MRRDRQSSLDQWSLDLGSALEHETRLGLETIASGETLAGASRFIAGAGRQGRPLDARSDSEA
jgi:enoyl-CoA hydratase